MSPAGARGGPARRQQAGPAGPVAVLERRGKFLVAEPFFSPGPRITVSRDNRISVGDLVVLRGAGAGGPDGRGGGGRSRGRTTVARRVGRPDVALDVIEALMLDRGLRRGFDPAVERDAREAAGAPAQERERRDLRTLPTFTIDPATARDFDDAISAELQEQGGARVWVHIADVSAFVTPRSLVDREAYRRSTSVYVPGAVEPMLPAELSNGACSLAPGQDRLAVTVEMTVRNGRVTHAAFYRSTICSDARLEYGQVDRIFSGTEPARAPWGDPLAAARTVANQLAEGRSGGAALEVNSSEPEFSFDRAGHVTAVARSEQTESHRLIEHLMVAANEQVAGLLERHRIPALYRVHERPESNAAMQLVEQLASLGVPTPPVPDGHLTPQQAGEVIGEASRRVSDWVARTGRGRQAFTRLVLRALKQAIYDHVNRGHAGLGLARYCHFTSPIRRYPDLICHRALLSAISGAFPPPEASWVAAAGPWTSAREREAMIIERDADDIARCFLLERTLRERDGRSHRFTGEVVGVISAGAFVAFGPEHGFEGMLPVRRLRGDWWELGPEQTMLLGTRTGDAIRLGDPIQVQVERIDAPRGRVDLSPAMQED